MINRLEQKITYQFQNKVLLKDALRHRSARGDNNERLEFLGDAILNFVIASTLYLKYPQVKEGDLSRLRANLVKGETLSALAKEFDLGNYIELGASEIRSGSLVRKSILADTMEAIVGAIYLDGGIVPCQQCILNWYDKRLNKPLNQQVQKDPKSRLQEYLQARQLTLPSYSILKMVGVAHNQLFYVCCEVEELSFKTEGTGANRREAEQQAAEAFLQTIQAKNQ
jgi:ribonuclease III